MSENNPVTKSIIFDLFYGHRDVVRSGGGKLKSKMTRKTPSLDKIKEMEKKVKENKALFSYFEKLRDRKSNIAPPPRPN
jgi:hypothetical protein